MGRFLIEEVSALMELRFIIFLPTKNRIVTIQSQGCGLHGVRGGAHHPTFLNRPGLEVLFIRFQYHNVLRYNYMKCNVKKNDVTRQNVNLDPLRPATRR